MLQGSSFYEFHAMNNAISEGKIDLEKEDGIARITFSHPKSNSFPQAQLDKLIETLNDCGKDPLVKVVLLQSSGEKAFCAGASFDELLAIKTLNDAQRFFGGFSGVILAIINCPKFVITRVQGKAVGGGVGIIAASDYAIGHQNSSIKLSELSIGFGPFLIAPAIEKKVGRSALAELAISTDWRDSTWAKEKGFFNQVCSTHEELDSEIDKLAERLASYSPLAMAKLKSVLNKGTENWDSLLKERAAISAELAQSDYTIEAINKFKKS